MPCHVKICIRLMAAQAGSCGSGGQMQTRRGRDGQTVGTALPGAVASLLPRLRKVKALKLALDWLPTELAGLAAPHEIKLAPAELHLRGAGDAPQVNTLF